jgi:hypothetical protein
MSRLPVRHYHWSVVNGSATEALNVYEVQEVEDRHSNPSLTLSKTGPQCMILIESAT